MLCAGLPFVGCTDDPLGGGENTEQGGNNGGQDNSEKKVGPATVSLEDATATTATFVGNIDVPSAELFYCEITVYYTDKESFSIDDASSVTTKSFDKDNNFNLVINKLGYNKKYNYWFYVKTKTDGFYSEVKNFTTTNVTLPLSAGSITATTAQISGTVEGLSESDKSQIQVGMIYSAEEGKVENGQGTKLTASAISSDNAVSFSLSELTFGTTYYYCSYVKQGGGYVYGEVKTFVAGSVSVNLSAGSITATTARISGIVEGLSESDKSHIQVGMIYSAEEGKVENGQGTKLTASSISSDNAVSFALSGLTSGLTYYYCSYVKQGSAYVYGEVKTLVAGSVSVNLLAGSLTATTAQITGTVEGLSESDKSLIEVGMIYSAEEGKVENGQGTKLTASEISSDNAVSFSLSQLTFGTTYYYCSYVKQGDGYVYGEVKTFVAGSVSLNLSDAGSITATTAQISGVVEGLSEADKSLIEVGMFYSSEKGKVEKGQGTKLAASAISPENTVSFALTKLSHGTTYYYCSYVKQGESYVYGEVKTFVAGSVSVNLLAGSITATTAQISGTVEGLSESDKSQIQVGMIYSSEKGKVENGQGTKLTASSISSDNAVSFALSGLTSGLTYYYCSYVKQGTTCTYGNVKHFLTNNITISVIAKQLGETAEFSGFVSGISKEDSQALEVGVAYSTIIGDLKTNLSKKVTANSIDSKSAFVVSSEKLSFDTKYYYCSYVKQNNVYVYGADVKELQTYDLYNYPYDLSVSSATDLSSSGSANCYIVSNGGLYKFKTVKGNSSEPVGSVASASIIWETFGTSETPGRCDLIQSFCYKDGYIAFQTADTFKEGNAVIAAKDADGSILWSWHIWLTDQPQGQAYYNNAGTMMDRNLGATSATPGDVGALGLLYQWGRKDPFLGSSSISSKILANSTITWPSAVSSDSSNGTIAYATANPTTFITYNDSNDDWYYTGSESTDNTRWTTSESNKSIYDPCPAGWRVPDGGENGVWSKAFGADWYFGHTYNSSNKGMNFSGKFGSASTIWYPTSGYRFINEGSLGNVGYLGSYWSASPNGGYAYGLSFNYNDSVNPSYEYFRARGLSVRCLQE